jgi:Tfp pilus assembly protein PilN
MQHVNLYQSQFKPKKVILPAEQLLMLAALPLLVLILLSIYLSYSQQNRAEQLENQQAQVEQQQIYLNNLTQQLNTQTQNPLLLAEEKDLQQQLQSKTLLLKLLNNKTLGNQKGFSTMLIALSQQHVENLWLTHFSLLDSGEFIALQGRAYTSDLIPQYIDNLAKSEQFHGKNFSVFQLNQDEKSAYFDFKLHTSKQSEGER